MKIISFIKDIFSPKKCYSCKKEGHFICKSCLEKTAMFDSICYVCKGKSLHFSVHNRCGNSVYYEKLIILTHYRNNIVKKLIKNAKFYGKIDIFEDFGLYLGSLLSHNEEIRDKNNYVIISVPMYFGRKLKRGYNHSDLLARNISKNVDIRYDKNIVIKNKNTRQQSKLSKKERMKNLHDAFIIDKRHIDKVDKKIIIIVDDVVSSGSTINELSKLLKLNGAKKVIGLLIASD